MPKYILCVAEKVSLSETRHEATWEAVNELIDELMPERTKDLKVWQKKHVAAKEEVEAWLRFFFKVKEYVPPKPPVDLSKYYLPSGYDTHKLAKDLKIKPKQAAIMLRRLDKALMVTVTEEILRAVKHSNEAAHEITLSKP